MPQVGQITAESNIDEFINYNAIKEVLGTLDKKFEIMNNDVLNILKEEITTGDLDLYATNINGVPVYHNKAVEVQQKLDNVYSECKEMISFLDKVAKQHRKAELNTYIRKLEEKIQALQKEIDSLNAQNQQLEDDLNYWFSQKKDAGIGTQEYEEADAQTDRCTNQTKENNKRIEELEEQINGGFWWKRGGSLEGKLERAKELLKELEG